MAELLEVIPPAPVADQGVVAFILAGGRGQRLDPLTSERPKPMIPAGGRYRIIDFTLSNCLNSGLSSVYVLVQHLSAELITYVHGGWRPYFPNMRGNNLQAIPPQFAEGEHGYQGTADALLQNRPLMEHARYDLVVVLAGDHIYKMDYRRPLASHLRCGADVTVAVTHVSIALGPQFGIVQRDALDQTGTNDLGRDIVPAMAVRGGAWVFDFASADRNVHAYWREVGTLDAYYDANMDLVAVNPELNLYDAEWPVRTAPLVAPPPKFVHDEADRVGTAVNSMGSTELLGLSYTARALLLVEPRTLATHADQLQGGFACVDRIVLRGAPSMSVGVTFRSGEIIESGRDLFERMRTHSFPLEQAGEAIRTRPRSVPGAPPSVAIGARWAGQSVPRAGGAVISSVLTTGPPRQSETRESRSCAHAPPCSS